MFDLGPSRRDVLRNIALSAALGGLSSADAQHAHHEVAEEKKLTGVYKPKAFNAREYKTLQRLSELIVPADERGPSALQSGAPEFIDLLTSANEDLQTIYRGGIAWLDRTMEKKHGTSFVDSKPAEQTAMLDLIAYKKNDSAELGAGIRFFDWCRKMVVDAYYTSPVGIKDIGYLGNKGMTKFEVPVAAIQYAVKRSGLG